MYATNVRNLKRNPLEALRQAELEPVFIMKGNEPNALLFNLKRSIDYTEQQLSHHLINTFSRTFTRLVIILIKPLYRKPYNPDFTRT